MKDCSENGICKFGHCFCNPGFYGDACSNSAKCLNDCNNHGICKYGKCFCDNGFQGNDCGEEIKCEQNCNNKGVCINGKCQCEYGYSGSSCEVTLLDAPCENNCNSKGICKLGKCFCYPGYAGNFCEIKDYSSCQSNNHILKNNQHEVIRINNQDDDMKEKLKLDSNICSGNGVCEYGKCACFPGFSVS